MRLGNEGTFWRGAQSLQLEDQLSAGWDIRFALTNENNIGDFKAQLE